MAEKSKLETWIPVTLSAFALVVSGLSFFLSLKSYMLEQDDLYISVDEMQQCEVALDSKQGTLTFCWALLLTNLSKNPVTISRETQWAINRQGDPPGEGIQIADADFHVIARRSQSLIQGFRYPGPMPKEVEIVNSLTLAGRETKSILVWASAAVTEAGVMRILNDEYARNHFENRDFTHHEMGLLQLEPCSIYAGGLVASGRPPGRRFCSPRYVVSFSTPQKQNFSITLDPFE